MVLPVTQEEKNRCYSFASQIIAENNQYNRFNKSREIQITRTYVGKLAEYVFFHFLQAQNINVVEGDMFKVFEGAENADQSDFILPNGKTIDIKTAWQPFHQRIMIPISQIHLEKDYYVGIKLTLSPSVFSIIALLKPATFAAIPQEKICLPSPRKILVKAIAKPIF